MNSHIFDVAVIGAGPIGSYVAYRLAGMGHRVVVLEQREKVGEKPCCTGIISHECATTFVIDRDVILREANSAIFVSPSHISLRLSHSGTLAYIINRSAFDSSMAAKAQSAGAEYQLNARVVNVIPEVESVAIDIVREGTVSRIEARAAVIAAGFGSPLPRRLGLGRIGDFASGAQAEVNIKKVDEVEVYFGNETSPGFFAWLVPTFPGKGLAGLFSRKSPTVYLKKFLSQLAALGKIDSAEAEIRYGGVPLKALPMTFGDKFLSVGDAAGQVKPTTGGGIYFGLLCADIATATLNQALKTNNLSAKYLSAYEREWRKRLGRELAIDHYARLFYERLNDRQIERLFGIINSEGIGEALIKNDLSFDWHGNLILKALRHNTVANAIKLMKLPFSLIRR